MITGRVAGRYALVTLRVGGPNDWGEADFFLDTGFAGFLTLPSDAITKLDLPYIGIQPSSLADSSRALLSIYRLTVRPVLYQVFGIVTS